MQDLENELDIDLGCLAPTTTEDLLKQFNPADQLNQELTSKIHLHIQKRTTRKSITTIEGLDRHKVSQKRILKDLRKKLSCNGNLKKTPEGATVIRVQGDHREEIAEFLKEELNLKRNDIVIHGF